MGRRLVRRVLEWSTNERQRGGDVRVELCRRQRAARGAPHENVRTLLAVPGRRTVRNLRLVVIADAHAGKVLVRRLLLRGPTGSTRRRPRRLAPGQDAPAVLSGDAEGPTAWFCALVGSALGRGLAMTRVLPRRRDGLLELARHLALPAREARDADDVIHGLPGPPFGRRWTLVAVARAVARGVEDHRPREQPVSHRSSPQEPQILITRCHGINKHLHAVPQPRERAPHQNVARAGWLCVALAGQHPRLQLREHVAPERHLLPLASHRDGGLRARVDSGRILRLGGETKERYYGTGT